MTSIRFEWDEAKSRSNLRKHGITFRQASQVFTDPLYVAVQDRVVDGEERWQTIGFANRTLLVMVAHTIREEQSDGTAVEVFRIISARTATPNERRFYEDENG